MRREALDLHVGAHYLATSDSAAVSVAPFIALGVPSNDYVFSRKRPLAESEPIGARDVDRVPAAVRESLFKLGREPRARRRKFRAYGPPDVTSLRFAQDFVLTKSLGSATSTERSAAESEPALFHTENPTTFWNHNFRDFAATKKLGIADNARLFAALTVSLSEGVIACWDSKYYYNFWRPITAITTTLDDGNAGTETDATWLPYANTPPHPEYPAAHGCATGAVAEALEHFFGTQKVSLRFTSAIANSVPHVYPTPDDLVEEVKWARVFGGMHYLTSTEHGATLGRKVGRYVMRQEFRPVHR
jgi:hypothetical protein